MAARHDPHRPRENGPRDEDFRAFAERGDVEALARYFDAAAPRLLLVAAHVAPAGVEPEDLVQQTFLEALRGRYEVRDDASALTWLASILRRRAIDEHRRAHRSREASLDDEHDRASDDRGPIERLMDDETFALVLAAIDALESPQREVVNMRLVLGHDPATIAHTLGRKPSTVRMQLKRGLERLREALPTGIAGALVAAVVTDLGLAQVRDAVLAEARRLAPAPSAEAPSHGESLVESGARLAGGSVTSFLLRPTTIMLALATFAVIGVAVLAPGNTSHGVPSSITPSTTTASPTPAVVAERPAPLAAESGRSPVATPTPAIATSDDEDQPQAPAVTGRLVDHDGSPIGGATIRWSFNRRLEPALGIDRETCDPVATDGDGNFSLPVDGDPFEGEPFEWVSLTLYPDASPRPRFRVPAEAFDPSVDLGTVALPALVPATLSVVDPSGDPITWLDGERASVRTSWSPDSEYANGQPYVSVGSFDSEGRTLPFLAPVGGLEATLSYGTGRVEDQLVVVAGEPNAFALTIGGPDPASSIVIAYREDALDDQMMVDLSRHATLVLANGSSRSDARAVDMRTLRFDEVPDGVHRIDLTPPGFEAITLEGVQAGDERSVVLRGACTVRLRVFDVDGERRTDYAFDVSAIDRERNGIGHSQLRSRAKDDADWEVYESVTSNDQVWDVVLPDGRSARAVITGLVPGETRDVTVQIAPPTLLRGTVLDHSGAPTAGVMLEVRPRGNFGSQFGGFDRVPELPEDESSGTSTLGFAVARTDAEGRFEILVDPARSNDLLVARSPWCHVLLEEVAHDEEVTIHLPGTRSVSGRVEGLPPEVLEQLVLVARSDALAALALRGDAAANKGGLQLDSTGVFAFEELPRAACEFHVVYPQAPLEDQGTGGWSRVFRLTTLEPVGAVDEGDGPVDDFVLDASVARPATIHFEVRVNGEPAPECSVVGLRQDFAQTNRHGKFVLPIGPSGTFTHEWVAPGLWTFGANSHTGPWLRTEPVPRAVGPGDEIHIVIDVSPVTGTVQFVDPEGLPLAETELMFAIDVRATGLDHIGVSTSGALDAMSTRTTDAEGRLELELLPGEVLVRARPSSAHHFGLVGVPSSRLEWTVDGPVTDTLIVERPDSD